MQYVGLIWTLNQIKCHQTFKLESVKNINQKITAQIDANFDRSDF